MAWGNESHGPEPDVEWSETQRGKVWETPIGDALNGLQNIPRRQPRLHQAAASTGAALHALCIACPRAEHIFSHLIGSFSRNEAHTEAPNPMEESEQGHNAPPVKSAMAESPTTQCTQNVAVDAYFEHFHALYPMIDELWFRAILSRKDRTDDGWVALSNMVLALGCIAVDDKSHLYYYERLRQVIGYNTFGSGNLEMLQALILLGGCYLHYVNSPNTASLILSTGFQMAISMGLHRDPTIQAGLKSCGAGNTRNPYSLPLVEVKRRTWWSLVCADLGTGIWSGRPKLNRWDSLTMDTALPSTTIAASSTSSISKSRAKGEDPEARDWYGTSLRYTAELAKILTKMGNCMARITPLTAQEVKSLDNQLQSQGQIHSVKWRHSINSCPRSVRVWQNMQHCYLLFARMAFRRPLLVRLAYDISLRSTMTSEDWEVVSGCQSMASELIGELSEKPKQSKIMAWYSSFLLFQACLVLLISIALASRMDTFDENMVDLWKQRMSKAILTFGELSPYTRPSDRYGEIIRALYDAVSRCDDTTQDDWQHAWTRQQDISQSTSEGLMPATSCWDWLDHAQDMATTGPFLDLFSNYFTFGQEGENWFIPPGE
ncbi:hypothetical protein THARTR1_01845 [Trichoderma harzianum]|uniref:Xylanolytic transcriptional activator regulatory domain-containing protein n=1 Tax=Trichoderma harzianum TaxID=5544 RepID=A0A2K0UKM5_TRIHA|nr:hypothetical protein THARTR1_01845 [Trichoderma harzianum]